MGIYMLVGVLIWAAVVCAGSIGVRRVQRREKANPKLSELAEYYESRNNSLNSY